MAPALPIRRWPLLEPLQRALALLSPGTTANPPAATHLGGAQVLMRIREDLVGSRAQISTPYGQRPLVYADYTASGRALKFLEDNIRSKVLPYYANTHTEASFTGAQTNALREDARAAVRRSVNGTADDKVIFCGSGATAAINRLIDILGLRLPGGLDRRYRLLAQIPRDDRPVIFVGPYEHHSNELPWRETIADVVRIGLDEHGQINQTQLAAELENFSGRLLRIGSFSAASNVTGIKSDVAGITRLLKDAGALAFWDFAAAAPYVSIDMNLAGAAIDAAFISPHKFVGGPGTPGVLVAKSHLFGNDVPAVVGGGTVSYVSATEHRYLTDPEHREEGGTPAIVESIRAGAVFALKDQIGDATIEALEQALVARALEHFALTREIELLGPKTADRLGICSMRIRCDGRYLHHGFSASLLNDLFGIQARGGCSCAGPYGHDLLNLDLEQSRLLDALVREGYECFKPGWVRVTFHYAAPPEEIDYILSALTLVATHGWRLLPSYRLNPQTGVWMHRDAAGTLPVAFADLLNSAESTGDPAPAPAEFPALLDAAEALLEAGSTDAHREAALREPPFPAAVDQHRWFVTAREAAGR